VAGHGPDRPRRYAYGPTPIEGLDVYVARRAEAPINVFIHGGAWRGSLARDNAIAAELFVNAGAHYVVPDFAWVQDVGGSLTIMADQVRRAIVWVYRNARTLGGNPGQLYVSGFSSGAHLAGVVLTTDWRRDFDLPADLVKGGLCCSGMFDLKAVRLSSRNHYVKFTDEMEQALSPQRHIHHLSAPLILAYGTLETPEFQRQSRDFAAAVRAAGKPVDLLVGEGYNHFDVRDARESVRPAGARRPRTDARRRSRALSDRRRAAPRRRAVNASVRPCSLSSACSRRRRIDSPRRAACSCRSRKAFRRRRPRHHR
jgi:arylformamidase